MITTTRVRVRRPVRTITDENGEQHTVRVAPPGRSNARRKAILEQLGTR